MSHTLQILHGTDRGRQYDLDDDEVLIGRNPDCHIVLDPREVSRKHARLVFEDNRHFIEDLQSRNGTRVNDHSVRGRVELKDRDRITICGTLFEFRSSQSPAVETDEDAPSSILCSVDATSSSQTLVSANAQVRLQAVLQITDALARVLDLKPLLNKMLDRLLEVFPQADRGLVLLLQGERLVPVAGKNRQAEQETCRYSRTVVEKVMTDRRALLLGDSARERLVSLSESMGTLHIHSTICAPLMSQDDKALGIIQLDTTHSSKTFGSDDMELLASVARQVAISVEYVQLHKARVKYARLEEELNAARQVQYSLLPKAPPEVPGYSFWGYYEAAGRIGGDLYDYLPLPNENVAVLLGDIEGKGVPAALRMAQLSVLSKVALLRNPDSLADAICALNREFCDAVQDTRLASIVLALINPTTHEVTLADAGHMPPMIRRNDGTVDETVGDRVAGFMLGVERECQYEAGSTRLAPGEFVLLFSDGVSDAMNSSDELYSTERIRELLRGLQSKSPSEIGEALLDDVRRHVGDREQFDDMSLVIAGRDPE